MKIFLSAFSFVIIISLCFTSQTFVSCTKETIHDTLVVEHRDTTIIYKHDTVQLTLESCCNPQESTLTSYYASATGANQTHLVCAVWTHSGQTEVVRAFTAFDYSDIPDGASIVNAKLLLYAMPAPIAGNMVDAHFGTANACYVQRITAPWSGATSTWNEQPSTDTHNQAIIPQSTSASQNDTINVTELVKDMLEDGNYGFAIKLQQETDYYNSRQYSSSFHPDAVRRPKLVVQYKKQ